MIHDKEVAERSTKSAAAAAENPDTKDLESLPPRHESIESIKSVESLCEHVSDQDRLIPDLEVHQRGLSRRTNLDNAI